MSKVETYYDRKSNVHGDEIQKLRKYNNQIKLSLLKEAQRLTKNKGDLKVLDLACGKMGDLHKWNKLKNVTEVWGVDVSRSSLRDAMRRYKALSKKNIELKLFKADLTTVRLFKSALFKRERFDLISSQFAMHYFWGTEWSAKNIIHTISSLLKEGGIFVTTIPSSEVLKSIYNEDKNHWISENGEAEIVFDKDMEINDVYGKGYTFTLSGSVGGLREFIIDRDNFIDLFEKEGMELLRNENFLDYEFQPNVDILRGDEEIIELYDVFIFRKMGKKKEMNEPIFEMEEILFYDKKDKETFYLSNYYPVNVTYKGKVYPSSEHAYQASKFLDENYKEEIRKAKTPNIARLLGTKTVKGNYPWQKRVRETIESYPEAIIRQDWDDVKKDIMREIVHAKFTQNVDLGEKLLFTGNSILVENSPRDNYWGIGKNKDGLNMLGKILMETREKIKNREELSF